MFKVKIKYECEDIEYFLNGNFHREDGPAVELKDGTKIWFLNGDCHNSMGPAIERFDINYREIREWWLYGVKYEFKDWYEKSLELRPKYV